jgi:hypothetical protein
LQDGIGQRTGGKQDGGGSKDGETVAIHFLASAKKKGGIAAAP